MDGDYRVQRFRNANEVHRLQPSEEPPALGWAIGANGLFHDGVKIAQQAEIQIGPPGALGFCEIRYVPLDRQDDDA